MLASILALAAASAAAQADNSAQTREAYLACLTRHVRSGREADMSPEDFDAGYAEACTAERTGWREAIIRRETRYGAKRAQAEEDAQMELDDARANFQDLYRLHTESGSVPEE